jgi:hypothetical protein
VGVDGGVLGEKREEMRKSAKRDDNAVTDMSKLAGVPTASASVVSLRRRLRVLAPFLAASPTSAAAAARSCACARSAASIEMLHMNARRP